MSFTFSKPTPCTFHRVFGNLQTWLNGTHHGVGAKYLPKLFR
jgi:hypothetical protein